MGELAEELTPKGDDKQDRGDELLFRQINPGFVHESRVTSQAFRPTPKDEGQLSVSLSSLTSAQTAYELYTAGRQLDSAGVMGVTRGECSALELRVVADPLLAPVEDPAHALVDFTDFGTNQIEKKSKKLGRKANARGWLYQPDDED
jgi:hypothetical protein